MKNARFLVSLCATAAFASIAAGCTTDDGTDASITVDNASITDIVDIRVAQVNDPSYGPNLLSSALQPDDQVTIFVACDTYDVKITADDGTVCVLPSFDLCFSDAIWTITEADLDDCADNGAFKAKHPNGFQIRVKNPEVSYAPTAPVAH